MRTNFIVADPKGDLLKLVLAGIAATCPSRLADVIYLNPFFGGFPFNINKLALHGVPLEIRARQIADLVATVSTGTGSLRGGMGGVGARQVDKLLHCILAALSVRHERANVLLALDGLANEMMQKVLAEVCTSPHAKQFLLDTKLSDELRSSCASRLRLAFAATGLQERMVSTPTAIDLQECVGEGKIVLVDLGSPPGGLVALQTLWANVLVRLLSETVLARESPWVGHHTKICIDEAQVVAPVLSDVAERLLTTGRSRGCSLTTMTQGTTLLHEASPTLLRVLLQNTPTKIVGRLNATDAELFAREQAPVAGTDESFSAVRQRLVGNLCNLPERVFYCLRPGSRTRLTSTTVDIDGWNAAAAERAEELAAVKARYALTGPAERRLTLQDLVPDRPRSTRRPRSDNGERPRPRSRWG